MLGIVLSFGGNTKDQNLFSRHSYSHWADKAITEMVMTECRIGQVKSAWREMNDIQCGNREKRQQSSKMGIREDFNISEGPW